MVRRAAKLVAFLLLSASALTVLEAGPLTSSPAVRLLPDAAVRQSVLADLFR